MMYNYISEKKFFQRNAAIAPGNSRDDKFVPDLAKAMHDKEEVVREYAAWGLGRMAGSKAKKVLEKKLVQENPKQYAVRLHPHYRN